MSHTATSLTITDLACERGARRVFDGLSLSLEGGEALVLTGPNGVGKSSLLRQIAGLVEVSSGSISLAPADEDHPMAARLHYVGHLDALKPAMSVHETARFWADFYGGAADVMPALDAFDLVPLATLPVAYLSAGQKRRLGLSRLLLASRVLWLLDEPTVGLDTASIERLKGLMEAHLEGGGMIMAATHLDLGLAQARHFNLADVARQVTA
ncbi:MAG: heme ABC exporter ATP-binding protein CcmA [Rhizobiales bacterium]|nr:heme ABC exporter ATP-binding protein CcmA [Hyphomicrobiales bacterium]